MKQMSTWQLVTCWIFCWTFKSSYYKELIYRENISPCICENCQCMTISTLIHETYKSIVYTFSVKIYWHLIIIMHSIRALVIHGKFYVYKGIFCRSIPRKISAEDTFICFISAIYVSSINFIMWVILDVAANFLNWQPPLFYIGSHHYSTLAAVTVLYTLAVSIV